MINEKIDITRKGTNHKIQNSIKKWKIIILYEKQINFIFNVIIN